MLFVTMWLGQQGLINKMAEFLRQLNISYNYRKCEGDNLIEIIYSPNTEDQANAIKLGEKISSSFSSHISIALIEAKFV